MHTIRVSSTDAICQQLVRISSQSRISARTIQVSRNFFFPIARISASGPLCLWIFAYSSTKIVPTVVRKLMTAATLRLLFSDSLQGIHVKRRPAAARIKTYAVFLRETGTVPSPCTIPETEGFIKK